MVLLGLTAWMLLRSLETLELRMSRAGENAAKVCAHLRHHPKVERVGYLGFLADEPGAERQADIYRRHCTGGGSTFFSESRQVVTHLQVETAGPLLGRHVATDLRVVSA